MSSILFLVPHPEEDAGYRYRVQQFLPHLQAEGHACTVLPFSTPELYAALRSQGRIREKLLHTVYCSARRVLQLAGLSRFDLVVIQREVFPFFSAMLERLVLRRHSKVVFAFDDAIYAGQDNASELNHPILYRLKYSRRIDEVIRRSFHVIAGNRILAEYAHKLNRNVSVIPTVVDCTKYTYREKRDHDVVTIGWVGSRSTAPYLKTIEPALRKLADARRGKVAFRFYGYPGYEPDLPNVQSLPFRLDTEIEDLHSLDIGLMPVPDTEWGRGKCAFKAIQYMASGVATVASPVGITPDIIQHNVNGFLADSNDAWFSALKVLVDERDVRLRLGQAARRTIEASYSLKVWGPKLAELFQQLLTSEIEIVSAESRAAHDVRLDVNEA